MSTHIRLYVYHSSLINSETPITRIVGTAISKARHLWYAIFFKGILEFKREFFQDVKRPKLNRQICGYYEGRCAIPWIGGLANALSWLSTTSNVKIVIAANFAYTHYQVIPCIFAMIFGGFTLAYHGNAKVE